MWTCPNCGREFKRTNQSHFCGSAPETVEAYIAALPEDALADFATSKGSIRVKHDQHIDPALVARIAAWCRENQQEEA